MRSHLRNSAVVSSLFFSRRVKVAGLCLGFRRVGLGTFGISKAVRSSLVLYAARLIWYACLISRTTAPREVSVVLVDDLGLRI